MSLMGQKRTNHPWPKSSNVRYCPIADKILRCVRLLKGETLLRYGNSAASAAIRTFLKSHIVSCYMENDM
jgi:hypothetical protein